MNRRQLLWHCTWWAMVASGKHGHAVAARPHANTLLVLGDSLSAEYGLPRGTGWVTLLERRLKEQAFDIRVANASISGETTSGGVSRLPQLLVQHRPSHVIVELGGNDALRGLPLAMTKANLGKMLRMVKAASAQALLIGMRVPPNYGQRYSEDFVALFAGLAAIEEVALVPFLLEDVVQSKQVELLFQSDGIHPNERAQPIMLDNVWGKLKPLLRNGQ